MRPPAMPPKRYGDEEFYHPEAAEGEQPPVRTEKTPGVYTREVESPQELDMLWSSTRLDQKEDRSPIVFFIVGFLLGGLITGLVVFLLTKQPEITTGEPEMAKPVEEVKVEEEPAPEATLKTEEPAKPAPAESVNEEQPKTEAKASPFGGLFGGKKAEKPPEHSKNEQPKAETTPAVTAQKTYPKTYTVQSGDTLGGIAYRQYGSSAPRYVDKIQRANNLKSPDSLQLGQKLVIPGG